MRHKLFTHTNARIFDTEFIIGIALRRSRFFSQNHADRAPGSRILHRITQQIQQYLIQAQFIAINVLVQHIHCIDIQFKLLGMNIRLQNTPQPMENIRQAAGLLIQMDLSALNPAHIQNIIDQTEQMIP